MYYYQKNVLGDITHIYDGVNLVCRYVYDAYGYHKVFDSNNNDITDNNPSTNIGLINPFRYRGYYYDINTKLYYCNSRYYSPYLKRWLNIDEFDYIDSDDILGLNLFAYCKNNPVRYTDEEGNSIRWETLDADMHISSFYETSEPNDQNEVAEMFKRFPWLNVSEVARAIGINKSLLARYIYGISKPSEQRLRQIRLTLHALGTELQTA